MIDSLIGEIRKESFTEIYNLQKHAHETGDVISRPIDRQTIYEYIEDNMDLFSNVGKG